MSDITYDDLLAYSRGKQVERLRIQYPAGTRIVLLEMDDPQAPPFGTEGTVRGVDDMGHIMVNWDTGGSLNLIHGVDKFSKVQP
jgi:hypothetical protein